MNFRRSGEEGGVRLKLRPAISRIAQPRRDSARPIPERDEAHKQIGELEARLAAER